MRTFLALFAFTLGIAAHAADFQRNVKSMDIPKYPPLAYQARIQGTVALKVAVDAEGRVTQVTIVSGHDLLGAPASENVKSWHFAAIAGGGPSEINVDFVYKIEGDEIPYAEPDKRRSRICLELPARVEVSAPPMKIETAAKGMK